LRHYVANTPWIDRSPADAAAGIITIGDVVTKCVASESQGRGLTNRQESQLFGWISHVLDTMSDILLANENGTSRFVHGTCAAAMEGAMHDSRTIANRLLAMAREKGDTLTPMQVLKLVYIAHGWMLGLYGRSLIKDDVRAWQYGPVIPRLYNAMRGYGGGVVTDYLSAPSGDRLDDKEDDVVRQVYEIYGKKTGPALSRLTHAPGTPWALTYERGSFGIVIPTDIIEDHYQQLAAK
jgi:uncharacterized phage-associated protein